MEQTDITEKLEEQTQEDNWLKEEAEKLKSQQFDGEKLPGLEFIENKIIKFSVDFTNKFKMWEDHTNGNTKAIIPVKHEGEDKLLWLNIKNPLYTQIVMKGLEGIKEFRVLQTGNKNQTKYNIVEE